MINRFRRVVWDNELEDDCRQLVRLAIREDLDRGQDWTTVSLVPPESQGRADLVVRQEAVIAGLPSVAIVLEEFEAEIAFAPRVQDGDLVSAGTAVGSLVGSARDLLTTERTLLNLLSRLGGVATLTRQFVQAVRGTDVEIFDTRKTIPGLRRLEKYAVGCGGGHNHRTGLFDAVLIKDNHLAFARQASSSSCWSPALAVEQARHFIRTTLPREIVDQVVLEIEVDTLAQLESVLAARPDVILLDNMSSDELAQAVTYRNGVQPQTILEASGGVSLQTIRDIAETGVDRISVGALTHSASSIDIGLDWSGCSPP